MKRTPRAYAEAYLAVLDRGTSEDVASERLKVLLQKNGDSMRGSQVIHELERLLVGRAGGKMVHVEFARDPLPEFREKILSAYSSKDRVTTSVTQGLLAGVRIVTNGEEELDVSLGGKLRSLLGN